MPGSSSTISSLRVLSVTGRCCHRSWPRPKPRLHKTHYSRAFSTSCAAFEDSDLPNHVLALLGCELGIDRQRQYLGRRALRIRKVRGIVLEISEAALRVQRHWIIDLRANAVSR